MINNEEAMVSIIIPLYVINKAFFKDLFEFNKLTYKNYELLVVCDKPILLPKGVKNARLIITGEALTGPAEKRDIALLLAKGKYCAFIDDDAYPHKDWLTNAIKHFDDEEIVAVGGPGITPKEDTYLQQLAGLVYESPLCSGKVRGRFVQGKNHYIDDWPAYNLIVRTEILKKIGGYKVKFYGGEDTFLCLDLIKEGRILYERNSVVYHHRRSIFFDLQKQISNVGKHRGYFFKTFPETSRKLFYLLPSILTAGFFSSMLLIFMIPQLFPFWLFSMFAVIFVGAIPTFYMKKVNIVDSLIVSVVIITVHIFYGYNFVVGLFTNKMEK